jgi:hypothetical protein
MGVRLRALRLAKRRSNGIATPGILSDTQAKLLEVIPRLLGGRCPPSFAPPKLSDTGLPVPKSFVSKKREGNSRRSFNGLGSWDPSVRTQAPGRFGGDPRQQGPYARRGRPGRRAERTSFKKLPVGGIPKWLTNTLERDRSLVYRQPGSAWVSNYTWARVTDADPVAALK